MLRSFAYFLIRLFSCCWVLRVLCIFWIIIIRCYHLLKYFSKSVACLPILLILSQKFLILMESSLSFFNLIGGYFTLLWWVLPYIDMNQPCMYMCTSLSQNPLPPPSSSHPSGSSQCTGFECPVSCIELGLVIYFTYGNIHVSVLFSQIIPPSPSPSESESPFYTSVSLLLSRIQGYHYHLSKFHIYALIYCPGVSFLTSTSLCIIAFSFIHLIRTDSDVFFLIAE